ncbi:MAG: DUF5996 family protein [Cyclobacteriaceae bacterium]
MEATNWYHLNVEEFQTIAKVRDELHQALQLVGMVSRSFLPPDPSDVHATSQWLNQSQSLAGNLVTGNHQLRMALRIVDTSLLFLDANEQVIDQFPLANEYYSDVVQWVSSKLADEGFDISKFNQHLPYQIPAYDQNRSFTAFQDHILSEFSGYFKNAHNLLGEIRSEYQSSTIVCWPHHFDIATLITLKPDPDPEKAKTIGLGLSPGDSYYDLPYFYLNTWPYLTKEQIQNETWSSAGTWHTKDWIGAVLPADKIITWESGEQQYAKVKMFLNEGVEMLQKLLV